MSTPLTPSLPTNVAQVRVSIIRRLGSNLGTD